MLQHLVHLLVSKCLISVTVGSCGTAGGKTKGRALTGVGRGVTKVDGRGFISSYNECVSSVRVKCSVCVVCVCVV